jgi:hypothetical protein
VVEPARLLGSDIRILKVTDASLAATAEEQIEDEKDNGSNAAPAADEQPRAAESAKTSGAAPNVFDLAPVERCVRIEHAYDAITK